MTTRTLRDALVGVLYIVVIASLVLLSIMIYNHAFTTYVDVSLRTDNVGSSLQKGSDVKVRGILVGEVNSISTDGDGADVHLRLTPSKVSSLPANMSAQLLPKTLFGERYVGLVFPSRASSAHLASGDTIDQDTSRSSVELERLFSDLLPVLRAVRPDKLAATLGEVALALRGRGAALGASIRTVGRYLNRLAPQVPAISQDLSALATTADTYTSATPTLLSGLDSLTTTSQVIANQRLDYANLLGSLTDLSHTVGSFVGTNSDQIIGLSRDSLPSLRIAARYSGEFPCLARTLRDYIPTASKAFGAGTNEPGAHVILHVVPEGKQVSASSYRAGGHGVCPYHPQTALASSALSAVPNATGPRSATPDGTASAQGVGPANSPQENRVISELVAPSAGLQPQQYPAWGSLLLGPALRGAEVSLR